MFKVMCCKLKVILSTIDYIDASIAKNFNRSMTCTLPAEGLPIVVFHLG